MSLPVLHCPDFSQPFEIQSDASNVGLGAVLVQHIDGQEKVVAYASRTLTSAERNFSVTEKECLGVLFAVEKFRPYVEGTHFTVITDHSSLKWLRSLKNPTGRLCRWIFRLDQFDFETVHRKGKLMAVADCLSRAPYNNVDQQDEIKLDVVDMLPPPDVTLSTDPWYQQLKQKITLNPAAYPSFSVTDDKIYKTVTDRVTNVLERRLVVPTDLRQLVIQQCHSTVAAAHMGFNKTLDKIRRSYYWPNMYVEVRSFVAKCRECQSFKATNMQPVGDMSSEPPLMKPMSAISVDLIGPLPRTRKQHKYILVCIDTCTKWVSAVPLRAATSAAVSKSFLEEIIMNHGVPDIIIADNGVQFIGRDFREMCDTFKIRLNLVPKYYPRANPVERTNRTLKTSLSIFAHQDHRTWDEHLKYIVFALRTSVSETTGFTPARLVYGRELRHFFQLSTNLQDSSVTQFDPKSYDATLQHELALIFDEALQSVKKAKAQQSNQYNLRHRPVVYSKGDLVWRKNFPQSSAIDYTAAKLQPKFVGPFVVEQVLSPTQYQLSTMAGRDAGRWPAVHLKPFT
jgi:transposase